MVLMAAVCLASFNPATTNTDATGSASTSVTLPPACPGAYVLTAIASDGSTLSSTVNEPAAKAGAGGLPNTSAPRPVPAPWPVIAGAALVLALVGSGLWLRVRTGS
jgi:hypothetical protein